MAFQLPKLIKEMLTLPGVYLSVYDWNEADEGSDIPYGDLSQVRAPYEEPAEGSKLFLRSNLFGSSDYSGSLVELSNRKAFLERFGECQGVHDVYGGHGTTDVAIEIYSLTEEMAECFRDLEDYCLMDEDAHTELEEEVKYESWQSCECREFQQKLQEKFEDYDLEFTEGLDSEGIDHLWSLFCKTERLWGNGEWLNESGTQIFFYGMDKVVETIDLDDLADCAAIEVFLKLTDENIYECYQENYDSEFKWWLQLQFGNQVYMEIYPAKDRDSDSLFRLFEELMDRCHGSWEVRDGEIWAEIPEGFARLAELTDLVECDDIDLTPIGSTVLPERTAIVPPGQLELVLG